MVVVAEPLAAPEHWGEVTDLFLAYQQAPVPSFCHITLPYARLLVERGYVVNENGRETVIQVRLCLVYLSLVVCPQQKHPAGHTTCRLDPLI